jgi:hypothetical protein
VGDEEACLGVNLSRGRLTAAVHGEQSWPGMKDGRQWLIRGLRPCSALMKWCNSTTVSSGSAGAFIGCWSASHGDGEVVAQSGGGGPVE